MRLPSIISGELLLLDTNGCEKAGHETVDSELWRVLATNKFWAGKFFDDLMNSCR